VPPPRGSDVHTPLSLTRPPLERWLEELGADRPEAAWDAFLGRYRALLFAAIRHYVRDHDDVMDVFTWVASGSLASKVRRPRAARLTVTHQGSVFRVCESCADLIRGPMMRTS